MGVSGNTEASINMCMSPQLAALWFPHHDYDLTHMISICYARPDVVSTNQICCPDRLQLFTAVEDFGSAMSKLRELGFEVNGEACELVYRAGAEVEVDDEAFAK